MSLNKQQESYIGWMMAIVLPLFAAYASYELILVSSSQHRPNEDNTSFFVYRGNEYFVTSSELLVLSVLKYVAVPGFISILFVAIGFEIYNRISDRKP